MLIRTGLFLSLYFPRMICPLIMLMYGKEASNRKQEIDRQYRTIPNQRNQRPKDKHYGKIKTFGFFHNADYYGIAQFFIYQRLIDSITN